MKKSFLSLTFLLSTMLAGCNYTLEKAGLFKTTEALPTIDVFRFSDQKITFDVVKTLSLHTCLQCHSGGSHPMMTPEKVMEQKDKILEVINEGSMPPKAGGYKPLTTCERKVLETWISDQEQGRTESLKVKDIPDCANAEAPKEKPKVDFKTLELSFKNLKKEILEPKCLSCHTEETAKETVLDNLETIKTEDLIGETAEDSILYKITVPGKMKRFMPPKRTAMAPLTEEETDYLKRWIEAGTPE